MSVEERIERLEQPRTAVTAIVLATVAGFVGGGLSLLLTKEAPDLNVLAILLGWPFLAFILILAFVSVFYWPIRSLLSRGGFVVKWGGAEISFSELEDKVKDETSKTDSVLEELRERIDRVSEVVAGLAPEEHLVGEKESVGADVLSNIRKSFDGVSDDETASLIFQLGKSQKFRWRTEEKLNERTSLSEDKIARLLMKIPNLTKRSLREDGTVLYRLRRSAREELEGLLNS